MSNYKCRNCGIIADKEPCQHCGRHDHQDRMEHISGPIGRVMGEIGKKRGDDRCFNCNENRPCKTTGTYRYEGTEYPILVFQKRRGNDDQKQSLFEADEYPPCQCGL